jgi:hypothetical protein
MRLRLVRSAVENSSIFLPMLLALYDVRYILTGASVDGVDSYRIAGYAARGALLSFANGYRDGAWWRSVYHTTSVKTSPDLGIIL